MPSSEVLIKCGERSAVINTQPRCLFLPLPLIFKLPRPSERSHKGEWGKISPVKWDNPSRPSHVISGCRWRSRTRMRPDIPKCAAFSCGWFLLRYCGNPAIGTVPLTIFVWWRKRRRLQFIHNFTLTIESSYKSCYCYPVASLHWYQSSRTKCSNF